MTITLILSILANVIYGGPVFAVQTSGFVGSLVRSLIVLALMGLAGRRART